MTTEYIGGDSVTEVPLCVPHCAVFLGSVKYHNVCSILYSMSLMITVQYLSVFCAEDVHYDVLYAIKYCIYYMSVPSTDSDI